MNEAINSYEPWHNKLTKTCVFHYENLPMHNKQRLIHEAKIENFIRGIWIFLIF